MTDLHELDPVVLVKDLPEEGLSAGQTGTVLFVHGAGQAFEVEFLLEGRRSVVCTVSPEFLLKLKGLTVSVR